MNPLLMSLLATTRTASTLVFSLVFASTLGVSRLSLADTAGADLPLQPTSELASEAAAEASTDLAAESKPASVADDLVAPPAVSVRQVTLIAPHTEIWPDQIEAKGNIMPWQETRVGAEIGGLRLVSVLANVGDVVKRGQVLARLNADTVQIELATANAQLMEAQAALEQAAATLDRAQRLASSGGVSKQELTQYRAQQQTAEARVNAAQAHVRNQELRLDLATLVAPDDGVISSRSAAEGAIVQAGSELFRLIRQERLEWRAEVKGETLLRVLVGQRVTVRSPLGDDIVGRVRQIAPTIDLSTRNGLVYVDLPADAKLKAGLYVSGVLDAGKRKALVLPSSAVAADGAESRVFKVDADQRIETVDVQIGRQKDDLVEISAGLDGRDRVVARDVGDLKSGDPVEVSARQAKSGN